MQKGIHPAGDNSGMALRGRQCQGSNSGGLEGETGQPQGLPLQFGPPNHLKLKASVTIRALKWVLKWLLQPEVRQV